MTFLSASSDDTWNDLPIQILYLGTFKFIFKNNLKKESGDQDHAFDEKKRKPKISIKSVPSMCENTHLQKFTTPG